MHNYTILEHFLHIQNFKVKQIQLLTFSRNHGILSSKLVFNDSLTIHKKNSANLEFVCTANEEITPRHSKHCLLLLLV